MTPGRLLEIAEQHPPETQEQTSGKAVFGSVPGHTEGQKMPGPLDHQSAAGTNCATECAVRAPESSARGPAADPIADLCAELRATHCSNENLHDNAAYELERPARTERLLRACMRHETARAERAEAERDALRECVLAADQTARFDLAWLISAINVHRHLPRPVGPELPKWYAENDRWLREASEMLNKIYSAENTPGSAAQPAEPPARSGRTRHDL